MRLQIDQTSYRSPNFGDRRAVRAPSMIIMHFMNLGCEKTALDLLCDPAQEVSAHYFIDNDGAVFQLVEDDKRAWHAGVSYWGGETDINSHSIGIEINNPGKAYDYGPYNAVQLESIKALSLQLMETYAIAPQNILGHSDIAPGRKEDPGALFPWQELAKSGIGLWPEDIGGAVNEKYLSRDSFCGLLHQFGYDPNARAKELIMAFHRHYDPEKLTGNNDTAAIDEGSVRRILSLLEQVSNAAQPQKIV